MLLRCYRGVTGVLLGCYRVVTGVSLGCYWGVLCPPIRCAPRTGLVVLIAYMCPYSLEINISSFKETVENLKISRGKLAPSPEQRIKRQQTVSSAECQVLAPNAGFLLASIPSYCRFRPIECVYPQSVSVSVPLDKIWGSAMSVNKRTKPRQAIPAWKPTPTLCRTPPVICL